MLRATTATMPSTLASYGVGILGLFSLASFSITRFFAGQGWCWGRRQRSIEHDHDHHSQGEIDTLREELDRREVEIEALRRSLTEAEERTRTKEEESNGLKEEIVRAKRRCTDLESQLKEAHERHQALAKDLLTRSRDVTVAQDETQRVQIAHGETLKLLEVRTRELSSVQVFLTKSDLYAGADVIKMVEELNAEIFQMAALMSESFEPVLGEIPEEEEEPAADEEQMQEALQHTEEILGEDMSKRLQAFRYREDREDMMLLQIVFQASMCAYTDWIMDSWFFHDRESEHLLQLTYEQLRETEDQAIASRWRVLTRKYVRQLFQDRPNLNDYFFTAFANILLVAGHPGTEAQLVDTISTRFSERMQVIVERAVRLNNVIGDDVTSCELVPIYCNPEVTFDPSSMDIAFDEGMQDANSLVASDEKILCTTDLGLLRAERVKGRAGVWDNAILLKPKVILTSGLSPATSPITSDSTGSDTA